jgi:hypothetical protein
MGYGNPTAAKDRFLNQLLKEISADIYGGSRQNKNIPYAKSGNWILDEVHSVEALWVQHFV